MQSTPLTRHISSYLSWIVVCLLLFVLFDPRVAGGDGKRGYRAGSTLRIRDRAEKIPGVHTGAAARLKYLSATDRKGRSDASLRVMLRVQVPSHTPLISEIAEADELNLFMILSREGVPYAACSLSYAGGRFWGADAHRVWYALSMRSRRGTLSAMRGSCDTNMDQKGFQDGVPDIRRGDSYRIGEFDDGEFLEGTL